MSIIDLGAFQPEPLEIKVPCGTIYTIPSSVSVDFMTKIMSLDEKVKKSKDSSKMLELLQNLAFEILSLDKSKTITIDTIKTELDDLRLLKLVPEIFSNHMTSILNEALPGEFPNVKPPKA